MLTFLVLKYVNICVCNGGGPLYQQHAGVGWLVVADLLFSNSRSELQGNRSSRLRRLANLASSASASGSASASASST